MTRRLLIKILLMVLTIIMGCQKKSAPIEIVKSFPINNTDGIISQSDGVLDTVFSNDGKGSLKITTAEPKVVKLYEVSDLNIEDARLIYKANIKTENIVGSAYLEMWCVFPGMGEFFSRSLQNTLSGTINWSLQETQFLLQKGQKPELIRLNVVIDGKGTLWIDDISLSKGPLQ